MLNGEQEAALSEYITFFSANLELLVQPNCQAMDGKEVTVFEDGHLADDGYTWVNEYGEALGRFYRSNLIWDTNSSITGEVFNPVRRAFRDANINDQVVFVKNPDHPQPKNLRRPIGATNLLVQIDGVLFGVNLQCQITRIMLDQEGIKNAGFTQALHTVSLQKEKLPRWSFSPRIKGQ